MWESLCKERKDDGCQICEKGFEFVIGHEVVNM